MHELRAIARALAPHGPPIVVYNAAHSGSRLLSRILRQLGVFMGAHVNDSEDSLDVLELVQYLVETHAPDFSRLFATGDPQLANRAWTAFEAHLDGRPADARWGWKLCETGHALPVIARLFPDALFVHLIRDGRDVAFSPFVAPKAKFWRKIHFGTDKVDSWRGMGMTQRAYRAHGHRFNAARWVNSVTLGRAYGAMLGDRYLEVRYEDLVGDLSGETARLAAYLGVRAASADQLALSLHRHSVGKWRRQPRRALEEVRSILGPTLAGVGYTWALEPAPRRALARLFGQDREWRLAEAE